MDPKIFIGVPTYAGMSYCLDEFLECIKNLNYSNFKILFADNSEDNTYSQKLQNKGFEVIKTKRFQNPRQTIVESRNVLREEFLKSGYDYFFSVEQDVMITPNIIYTLLKHQKDIISGVYYKTKEIFGIKTYYPLLMIACDKDGNQITTNQPDCLIRDMYRHEVEDNKLIQVEGSGLGCILITRKVLEKIKFRFEEDKAAFDDMFFALDAKNEKFQIWADTSLKCKHNIDGKLDY